MRRFAKDEDGQMLPLVAIMLTALIGISGTVLDIGHSYYTYRRLQVSTNAAALAGAASLTCPVLSACSSNSGVNAANSYSSIKGGANAYADLPNVTMVSGYPAQKCLTSLQAQGMACVSPTYANAVAVKQTVAMPLYFWAILGKKSFTITTSATAAMRGASPTPYNVAIILDESLSMNNVDADCGNTQIACALSGTKVLLQSLEPCAKNLTTCTITNGVAANSVDRVSVFAFPQSTISTVANYYNCSNSSPTAAPYTFPTATATSYSPTNVTYQVTPFLSDYKTSATATTLNPNSALTVLSGGKTGCNGMTPPNPSSGYIGTYYASVIYSAQAALVAAQAANPGSQNVMIILSDGDATAPAINSPVSGVSWPIQSMQQTNDCGFGNLTQSLLGASNVYGYWCGFNYGKAVGGTQLATNSGTYPSYVGECGQGVKAATAATAAGTRVYSIAYGSEPTGCASDTNAGSYPNISPCQTMADMASAPQYFFSDYKQTGSLSTCYANVQSVTSLNDIFTQIANDLTTARLIPDNTT